MFSLSRTLAALFVFAFAVSPMRAETAAVQSNQEEQNIALLGEVRSLIDNKKLEQAVEKCDQIIDSFQKTYKDSKQKIYCVRSGAETLGYMAKAAIDKVDAIAISPTWADAYFLKGYALQDLQRIPEAKESLQRAVDLSPFNSQYLSELASIFQIEKNWTKAKELFKEAEDNAGLSSEEFKADELGRARRGYAYCLVEEGKLEKRRVFIRNA